MKIFEDEDGTVYRLGRDAVENTALVGDADPVDWWFHLEGHPSGHCIVETLEITEKMVQFAGRLVVDHCSFQKTSRVVYCQVRDVKLTKVPGRVTVDKPRYATIKNKK